MRWRQPDRPTRPLGSLVGALPESPEEWLEPNLVSAGIVFVCTVQRERQLNEVRRQLRHLEAEVAEARRLLGDAA